MPAPRGWLLSQPSRHMSSPGKVIIELNHMLHRLCGPPSIPLSFTLASILPRRCTQRVCFGTGLAPDAWCTSFTARTTRVSKPVRSPRLRASASVHGQASAFATGVLPEIYRFHPSSRNSDAPSCTQARQFQAHHGVEPRTFTPGLTGRLRALYAQSFRTTLAPYVLPRPLRPIIPNNARPLRVTAAAGT